MRITQLVMLIMMLNATLSVGCSTIRVHSDDSIKPGPYVGTKHAVVQTVRHWKHYDYYGQVLVYAADVPLCVVADTVLLPYDVYNWVQN